MKMVELPEGSEKKSYYKFINVPLEPITPDEERAYKHMKGDPARALQFKDRAKLQDPDFQREPEGHYILDDGSIVISTCVEVENFTKENLEWFMIWHQLDPLRYAIWNPEDHAGITISDEDRARFLDKSIPVQERLWGTTSHVMESMNGGKVDNIDIPFSNPNDYGFDTSKFGGDNCCALVCSSGMRKLGPVEIPMFMTELVRRDQYGKLVWIGHWWVGHGYNQAGEEASFSIPRPLRRKVAEEASMLIVHNHKEVRHLDKFIANLYAENKDNWLE